MGRKNYRRNKKTSKKSNKNKYSEKKYSENNYSTNTNSNNLVNIVDSNKDKYDSERKLNNNIKKENNTYVKGSFKQHQTYVSELESEIKDRYQLVLKEIEYRDPISDKLIGELDLVGIINGVWHIYEVKCNDGYEKAVNQLYRAKKYLSECADEILLFYYSGSKKELKEVA
ncbi:hypothetical protein HOK51_06580 [Candidatus Woesearchaeota archaeon]|jgi:hypothetical protein|nr:hypothetical protein [Candidatus Woesearchaeota archaeon]MBT6519490.1 hypothetical protein [Candidatus Woesearchaeota archaeon]MBT7368238.1 hypothetical protein [Candidatus Woesearchaeota archaeon]